MMQTYKKAVASVSIAGWLVTLLGAAAMLSWKMDFYPGLQIKSEYVPIAFNSAFCQFLCGISLLTIDKKLKWISALCAIIVALFAAIVGFQYIIGEDFGIDQFFSDQKIGTRSSHPGRMAPNTVLYLILAAIGLLCWQLRSNSARLMSLMLAGFVLLLLSLIAVIGYIVKVEMAYSWWGLSDMSLPAGFSFLIISVGLLGLAYISNSRSKTDEIKYLLPIAIAAIGTTITLLIIQALLVLDRDLYLKAAVEKSAMSAAVIRLDLDNTALALVRMKNRLEITDAAVMRQQWLSDANRYIQDNSTLSSLAWIDGNNNITFVPYKDNVKWKRIYNSLPRDLDTEKNITVLPLPSQLPPSQFLFVLPINKGDQTAFLVAIYDISKQISRLPNFRSELESYREIFAGNDLIFSSRKTKRFIWEFAHDETIEFYGSHFRIRETINGSHHENPGLILLILFCGIGLSFSLANAKLKSMRIQQFSEILKQSDNRYARTTGAAQVGLWDWDLIENKVTWAGNAWELFGADTNEDIWQDEKIILDMIPEEDRNDVRTRVLESIAGNDGFCLDYRTRRMDGKEIWVQSRGKVVAWKDGAPTGISGTIIDITKQKQSELLLLRSNQELERFAYVASHDLKSPLRAIDNLAKWVLEDTIQIMPVDAQKKLNLLRSRTQRLDILLDDILSYSRAGRIIEEPISVDMNVLVRQVADTHLPKVFKIKFEKLPFLVSPITPLEQIFGNLFSNAVKHHDKETGTVVVAAFERDEYYEFVISDDGPGIPPEFHQRVFEMFQTLQPRDRVDGSGMGMAIIKKLVEWSGGKVWITAAEPRGTSIHFLWPRDLSDIV